MILTFELVKPETVSDERLFALIQRARQIAVEIDGVYDLALYRTEYPNIWQCSIDTEDEQRTSRRGSSSKPIRAFGAS